MPPPVVKTIRDEIYWQYAKLISKSAGFGINQRAFQMERFIEIATKKGNLARLQLDAARFADLLAEQDLDVISSYRSSNPMFALFFGNDLSGKVYADKLCELYPNAVFYSIWNNRLYRFKHRLSTEHLKENITKYIIQGSYVFSEARYSPAPPSGMKYFAVKKFGDEGFYRLMNKEMPAADNSGS